MSDYFDKVNELLAKQVPFVSVILVDATGSVPQDAGTKMLVTANGLYSGTVGGGKVEKKAIDEAIALLENHDPSNRTKFFNWSLDRDVGMTCGGLVKLFMEKHNASTWNIVVFGAGHVANSLLTLLITLDCKITCIDPRQEWLDKLPESSAIKKICTDDMPSQVKSLPDGAFVLLMTMGHTTDKPILLEILRTRTFPYIGAIGSEAKAVRLRNDVTEAGLPEEKTRAYFCPVGLKFGTNHPREIAISIAAQLLQERDLVLSSSKR